MSSRKYMVLSAVGADRPGLVQKVSALIQEGGGNLEDSRMAILGGEFALILLFSGDDTAVTAVEKQVERSAEALGLTFTLRPTQSAVSKEFLPYQLRVDGVDRPGIVSGVTAVLAAREINVAALESRVVCAPHSGTPMFSLKAELQLPSQIALGTLRRALQDYCDDENLDVSLEAG